MSRRTTTRRVGLVAGALRPGDRFVWHHDAADDRTAWRMVLDIHDGSHDGACCSVCDTLPAGRVAIDTLAVDAAARRVIVPDTLTVVAVITRH